MDALRTGIYTVFNTSNNFNTDVNGRLFFGAAPDGTTLADGPYSIFFYVSDNPDDVFAKEGKEVYVQFSLFSGDSSPAAILKMDKDLTALYKDTSFTVTGWTVVNMKRLQGSGPMWNPADVETGAGFYWQTDVDFQVVVQA